MNTNSLKRFATKSRNQLMQGVRNRLLAVGFNADGSVAEEPKLAGDSVVFGGEIINDPLFYPRWQALRERIKAHGVKDVIEEAAYTWFNRLMAIRILVRNGLCTPVLDYENPAVRLPRIVTDARAGRVSGLSEADREALNAVIDDGSRSFEQFSILISSFCKRNPIVSACFGGITDYTALLLPSDILGEGGFIDLLNSSDDFIASEEWSKPELIGWLYQFYISEKKDEVMAKKGGYDSDEIPAATQIFTPNWIVKYMVENTLGRIYLDNNPGSSLGSTWKYLVEPAEPTPDDAKLRYSDLEELKCADLSCGSGHILNEMFDLLMQLYTEEFYSPRQAVEVIFTKNMVGIDLDIRARQLAQFALLLKACQTDNAFADGHCLPRIYSFPDVKADTWLHYHGEFVKAYSVVAPSQKCVDEIYDSLILMEDAGTLGSIMKFHVSDETRDYLKTLVAKHDTSPRIITEISVSPGQAYLAPEEPKDMQYAETFAPVIDAFRIILALTDKYSAICMNPPYMATNKESRLKNYAVKNYPDSKSNLFAVFMDVAIDRLSERGKYGMINMQSWMFLSSYENLRKRVLDIQQIDSFLHLGPRTFDELSGEVVQNAAFVISNEEPSHSGIYYRLIDGQSCETKKDMFLRGDNRYIVSDQKQFENIPGALIGYWISEAFLLSFENCVDTVAVTREGLSPADVDRFLRLWHETTFPKERAKWFPYQKGGTIRKWSGNQEYLVDWWNDGYAIKNNIDPKTRRVRSHNYNGTYGFKAGFTWSAISSKGPSFRYVPEGFLFDSSGSMGFAENEDIFVLLASLNSIVSESALLLISPTLKFMPGQILQVPYKAVLDSSNKSEIRNISIENINISKQDWDAHETSWDFQGSELLGIDEEKATEIVNDYCDVTGFCISMTPPEPDKLEWVTSMYKMKWEAKFMRLHANEEELNRRFIEIYGLQDELNPHVDYEEITILQQGEISLYRPTHGVDFYGGKEEAAKYGEILVSEDEVEGIVVEPQSRIIWNDDMIIKQFISYAVGVMMGRYRLDRPGLAIAHPNPTDEEAAPYRVPQTGVEWWIDDDGIVPMMGADCGFHDNAANRFDAFIEAVFGAGSKTANLNFVREALGKDIVDYFRNDFYADHKDMYQKRPIYWMFSSSQKRKRAAFQCLVYMHRMNRFTAEKVRTDYLLPYIETLAARQAELQALASLTAKQARALKQVTADLAECRDYQLRLHDFADRQIEIDLDDGVEKNYATFADVLAKRK